MWNLEKREGCFGWCVLQTERISGRVCLRSRNLAYGKQENDSGDSEYGQIKTWVMHLKEPQIILTHMQSMHMVWDSWNTTW